MDSNAKEFWHVRAPIERPFVLNKGKTYSYVPELTTVLPIENLPVARVFIRVRNRPPRERKWSPSFDHSSARSDRPFSFGKTSHSQRVDQSVEILLAAIR
jgi:hypothetical protein